MDRPFRLLLVEDEKVLRGLVGQFLRRSGYAVVEAADGLDGLREFDHAGPFDLVITDLMMPRVDGLELAGELRSRRHDQPIIACSAALHDEAERRLREVGVYSWLHKPYHPEALLARIEEQLADRRPAHLEAVGLCG
jgi:DNA-binding response OmpR family regulator